MASWTSGSELLSDIIDILKTKVEDDQLREDIYIDLINAFEDFDCDVIYECLGEDIAFDAAYNLIYEGDPDEDDIDDDLDDEDIFDKD
jgi:hypothetical protein